jgi:hypothetical protein
LADDNSNITISGNSLQSSAISIGNNARAVVNHLTDGESDTLRALLDQALSALATGDERTQADVKALAAARADLDAGKWERARQKVVAFLTSAGASLLAGSLLEGLRAAVGR